MKNRLSLFKNTLSLCELEYEKNPMYFPLKFVIDQIKYLIDVEEGKDVDLRKLDDVKIGWIAAREFDGYANEALINSLHEISREVEMMKNEYKSRAIESKKKGSEILLMQALNYPPQLIEALILIFKKRVQIEKAFLSLIQLPQNKQGADYLVAVQLASENSIENEISQMRECLSKVRIDLGGKGVIFVNVKSDPFSNYFSKISPFYQKN